MRKFDGKALLVTLSASLPLALPATAVPISWTNWSDGQVEDDTAGSATGEIPDFGGVAVSYTGEMQGFDDDPIFPVYEPESSYTSANVDNGPPTGLDQPRDGIEIHGRPGGPTNTISFSQTVVDPIMAVFSLGNQALQAEFDFGSLPFVLEGGGVNLEHPGSGPLFVGGPDCPAEHVCGTEGNGTIRFIGNFDSISWTNPIFEDHYTVTVGISGVTPPIPEPSTALLLGMGLAWMGLRRR